MRDDDFEVLHKLIKELDAAGIEAVERTATHIQRSVRSGEPLEEATYRIINRCLRAITELNNREQEESEKKNARWWVALRRKVRRYLLTKLTYGFRA